MIEILPIEKIEPYFKVVIDYMIGDADGNTQEELKLSREELEEYLPIILSLNKLKPLKGTWGICLSNYPEKYPGEYIGLTMEEYRKFYDFVNSDEGWDFGLYGEREYYFVCFEGITVTYIDENNAEHKVKIS